MSLNEDQSIKILDSLLLQFSSTTNPILRELVVATVTTTDAATKLNRLNIAIKIALKQREEDQMRHLTSSSREMEQNGLPYSNTDSLISPQVEQEDSKKLQLVEEEVGASPTAPHIIHAIVGPYATSINLYENGYPISIQKFKTRAKIKKNAFRLVVDKQVLEIRTEEDWLETLPKIIPGSKIIVKY